MSHVDSCTRPVSARTASYGVVFHSLMGDDPKISILMPVRDASGTLPVVLESVRCQTFADWELLVVDDGSKDETAGILASAARADARIRVLSQAAFGIVEALQRGCAAARGEFIARMDADDRIPPERLLRQLEFFVCHPQLGVVSCRVRHGGDPTVQAGYAAHVAWINSLLTPEDIALRRFVESPLAHPSVMFRRRLLQEHGGYESGDFPEDYELWLRWMDAGVQFGKVDAELLLWNDLATRLSRTDQRYRPDAFYRIKCLYLARWLKRELEPFREIWLWGAGRGVGGAQAGPVAHDPAARIGAGRARRAAVPRGDAGLRHEVPQVKEQHPA